MHRLRHGKACRQAMLPAVIDPLYTAGVPLLLPSPAVHVSCGARAGGSVGPWPNFGIRTPPPWQAQCVLNHA